MHLTRLSILATALLLPAGVSAQLERPVPYPLPVSRAWQTAVKRGTRTNEGRPGEKYWTNRAHYQIEAELDPKTAVVSGHIDMTYHNRSPDTLRELRIHVRQNLHKPDSMRNEFVEITGGATVDNVFVDAVKPRDRDVRIRGTVMTVRLAEALRPDESVTVSMDWKFRCPKAGGAPRMGHENHHVYYLGYWYPQFAVYDDVQGWVADQYMGNSEFYMGYADYDLAFTAPAGWLVHATGSLENPGEVLTDAARERLARASSSRDIVRVIDPDDLEAGRVTRVAPGGKLTWRFQARDVRDAAVSVSDRYVWDATHAVVKDRDGPGKDGVAMIHAVYETNAAPFRQAAEFARHTIEHMSKEILPYPWPHMTVCEGIIGGGMEFPMMTIIGSRGRSVHGVVAHELIHMWFPMIVGSNEKARAWQDEGITSYYTTETTGAYREEKGQRRRRSRRMGGYLAIAARGEAAPLMRHGDRYPPGNSYGMASYGKTEVVMRQLRQLLGDENYATAMRRYAADWAFKHPYPRDLFRTFSSVTGKDMDWYFRVWFYETWMLDQAVASVASSLDGKHTHVVIEDRGMATHPTTVEVTYVGGEKETQHIDVAHWLAGKKRKRLSFGPDVVRVVVDPQQQSLDVSRRNNVWRRSER